jgi:DNA gyrase subunit A
MAQTRERIVLRSIEEEIRESFLDYSMSVIVQRALPDVRDGLKPVHRRILFAMHELGLLPSRPYKKSATVVGEVLGKYHPHGDTAVYDALVRMVQDFALRYPLVDGQGNFGSIDGDAAAAYRYTEARLAHIATELLAEIEKDTVDWLPNFDNRLQEPTVLPSRIPNLLVNGSAGIAVGMSTNVPPHNLEEVAAALRVLVEDPDCTVDDLLAVMPGPDFPTGGFIVGREGIRSMYETGRGRVLLRGRVVKEALRGGKEQLVVTELPYAVSKSKLIAHIASLVRKGSLENITELRDESDRDGMRLVIELKRGANAATILRALYKRTNLQTTFGAILLALDDGQPRELTLKEILEHYRDHRLEVIQRRSRFDLRKAEADYHVTEGLLTALDNIDLVISIIRDSRDRDHASERLQEQLDLTEIQADAILNMRLSRLTALEHEELRTRLSELQKLIRELRAILGSEERQLTLLLQELDEVVARYGDDRRTVILDEDGDEEVRVERALADEDVIITVSHEGFVKRIPMHLYRRRVNSGKALAGMERFEEDYLERLFIARTRGWILCFTAGGHCHYLPVLEVPEGSRSSRGQSIYALCNADRGDRVVSLVPVDDLTEPRLLVFLSDSGLMKRTALTEFSNPRSGGVIASGLKPGDRVRDVILSDGTAEVMLLSRQGRAIRFPETDISILGRTAQGVKGIDLRAGDAVVGMLLIRRDAAVLTVSVDGLGKRTPVADFPQQKRGGLGNLALPSGGEAGALVAAMEVLDDDAIMIVSSSGQIQRLRAVDVPLQGRRTRGARLVKLSPGERVVEVTRAEGDRRTRKPEASSEGPAAGGDTDVGVEETVVPGANGSQGQLDLLG